MKPICLIVILFSCFLSSSQFFKVVKATSQNWSGGVAGHYGTNYQIVIETKTEKAAPDTVWINGNTFPLNFSITGNRCRRSKDSVTGKITYSISASEAHN